VHPGHEAAGDADGLAVGEEPGPFQHDVDIAPVERLGIALGADTDRAEIVDGANRDILAPRFRQRAHHVAPDPAKSVEGQ